MDEAPNEAAPVASEPRLDGADVRLDGWFSMISGIGTGAYDKVMSASICTEPVTEDEARAIYRADAWGARAAEIRPREMLRAGWECLISDAAYANTPPDPAIAASRQDARRAMRAYAKQIRQRMDAAASETKKLAERVEKKARSLKLNKRLKQALTWENAYGGAGILIGALDGATDWAQPLDTSKIDSPDKLKFLTVLEPRHLEPLLWQMDPRAEGYGEVAVWRVNPNASGGPPLDPKSVPMSVNVHASRLIIFEGIKVSRTFSDGMRPGFGDSIYTRLKDVLRRFGLGWNSAAIIINEFSLTWMKIKGLAAMVAQDGSPSAAVSANAQKKLMARMAGVKLAQSIARITLLDTEEEFGRDTASVAGLADLLEKIMQELAGAVDVPVTVFMGMSPAGLNATGESDIRGWYDRVAAEQIDKLDGPLSYIVGLILRCFGSGKEPENWCIHFKPLYQESPKEKAETFKTYAEADQINVQNGLYTGDEARASRFGGDTFGTEIMIDGDTETGGYDAADAAELADAYGQTMKPGAPQPMGAAQAKPIDSSKVLEIVEAVTEKTIPRESGLAILKLVFGVDDATANALLGPVNFEAPTPPAPVPFGGGAKPDQKPPTSGSPDQKPPVPTAIPPKD